MKKKPSQSTDWKYVLFGVGVILFGLIVLDDPIVTFTGGVEVDLRPFNVPLAIVAGGLGGWIVWVSLSRSGQLDNSNWICPECQKTSMRSKLVNDKCPDCDILMEPLKGYYKRHPELVDKGNEEEGVG